MLRCGTVPGDLNPDGTTLFATTPIMAGFEPGTSEAGNRTQDLASSCLVLHRYTTWGPESQVFLMWDKGILMGCLGRESNPGPGKSSMLALPLSHTMADCVATDDVGLLGIAIFQSLLGSWDPYYVAMLQEEATIYCSSCLMIVGCVEGGMLHVVVRPH